VATELSLPDVELFRAEPGRPARCPVALDQRVAPTASRRCRASPSAAAAAGTVVRPTRADWRPIHLLRGKPLARQVAVDHRGASLLPRIASIALPPQVTSRRPPWAARRGSAADRWGSVAVGEPEQERARVTILDDGRGLEPEPLDCGAGILGMRERAALLGGSIAVEHAPPHGTVVTLDFPRAFTGLALALFAFENPATITVYFAAWTWEHVPVWYPVAAGELTVFALSLVWTLAARFRWRLASEKYRRAKWDMAPWLPSTTGPSPTFSWRPGGFGSRWPTGMT
jgi:hypothetical protein